MTGQRLWIPVEEPHKAVSGRIQGSAGNIIGRAMISCHRFLSRYNEKHKTDYHLFLQIHDELLFDFPEDPDEEVMRTIKSLMEEQGEQLGIPIPTSGKLIHYGQSWSEGEAIP